MFNRPPTHEIPDSPDGREARAGIADWMTFYNELRPHQALGDRTPMAVWRAAAGETGTAASTTAA